MEKINMFIDCDPGHDDAVALMVAGKNKEINLLGVGTTYGNQILEKTTKNAQNIVSYLGIKTKIYKGSARPLERKLEICSQIHGTTGLDGFDFPKTNLKVEKESAIDAMIRMSNEVDDLVIVATGPLTDVALAIKKDKELAWRIKEIVIMGGVIGFGNVTPAAEFNILCDPEAAEIVFNSGAVVKMMGLDVTRRVQVLPEVITRMEKINNKASILFVALMKFFNETQKAVFGLNGGPLHDPVTIVYLLDNQAVTLKQMSVVIDVSKGPSYGRTNCDQFNYLKLKKNAYVAIDIDVNKYWDTIEENLRNYNK